MRFVIAVLFTLGLAVVLTVGLVVGCGARIETAKNKVLQKIDSMLGDLDVKRTEIGNAIKGLKDGIDGLSKARIRATVKLEQIGRDMEPAQQALSRVDNALKVIRPNLDKKVPVEIAGAQYPTQKLQEMANRLLDERKSRSALVDGLGQARSSLEKTVSLLESKQDKFQTILTRLQGQVAEIDAKILAAKAMKDASASMGDSDQTLADSVANLETKIKDLFTDVEVAVRTEGEKWDLTSAARQIDSVDSTLAKIEGPAGAAAEIDKLLGQAK